MSEGPFDLRGRSATLPTVDDDEDLEERRDAWRRQQARVRRGRDLGLLLLALGVLVLVYVALLLGDG